MKRYIHASDAVFALILFCAFALSMLMILMTGARAYQDIRDTVENHYSENTCIDYIATKFRHYDAADSVYIGAVGDAPAICLVEEAYDIKYITYIYFYEGSVRELFVEDGYEFAPEDGLSVLPVGGLTFEYAEPGLLYVKCTGTGGVVAETFLGLRSGRLAG